MPPPPSPSDDPRRALAAWAEAWCRYGDEAAARSLVDALYPQVIRIVQNHLPRGTTPEELAQAVFVQFFRTLERYDPKLPLENWTFTLALRVCLNALRAARRRPEVHWADLTEGQRVAAEALLQRPDTAAERAPRSETRQLLATLLESLAPEDRLVVTLLHLEERSVEEIARLLGTSRVVVRMRAYRARNRLRRFLEQLGAERP